MEQNVLAWLHPRTMPPVSRLVQTAGGGAVRCWSCRAWGRCWARTLRSCRRRPERQGHPRRVLKNALSTVLCWWSCLVTWPHPSPFKGSTKSKMQPGVGCLSRLLGCQVKQLDFAYPSELCHTSWSLGSCGSLGLEEGPGGTRPELCRPALSSKGHC